MAPLIDVRIAAGVARRFAGDAGLHASYLIDRLERDMEIAVPRAEQLVAEASGIPAPPPVRWAIVDRATWAEANIEAMRALLGPLAEKVERRLDSVPLPARLAQRSVVSLEVGVLLGYISRRVLGQYDILVPEGGVESSPRSRRARGSGVPLYFVGPNMVETERRYGFVPEEFALWVAVHEVTHRFQFEGVTWLRPHFLGLVHSYLESMELDAKGLAQRLAVAAGRLLRRSGPAEERSAVYLFATDEQRTRLNEIQALMAVVEGHGNFVMDHVGGRTIPSYPRMRHIFQRRREQTTALQRAVNYIIGLEMKLRQYELGQQFCDAIVAREGHRALDYLWADPSHLPTMSELSEPRRWLSRVA